MAVVNVSRGINKVGVIEEERYFTKSQKNEKFCSLVCTLVVITYTMMEGGGVKLLYFDFFGGEVTFYKSCYIQCIH